MTPAEIQAMGDEELRARDQEEARKCASGSLEWDNSFAFELLRRLQERRDLLAGQPREWPVGPGGEMPLEGLYYTKRGPRAAWCLEPCELHVALQILPVTGASVWGPVSVPPAAVGRG